MVGGPPYFLLFMFLIGPLCNSLTLAQPKFWISEVYNSFYSFNDTFIEIYDGGLGNVTLSNIDLLLDRQNKTSVSVSLNKMVTDKEGFLVLSLNNTDKAMRNILEKIQNETVNLKLTITDKQNPPQIIDIFEKEKGWSDVISCFRNESKVNAIVLVGKEPTIGKINNCPLSPVRLDLFMYRTPFNLTVQLVSHGIEHFPLTNHVFNFFRNDTLVETFPLGNYSTENRMVNITLDISKTFNMTSTYSINLELQINSKKFVVLESLYFGAEPVPAVNLSHSFMTYPDKNPAQWVAPVYLQLVPSHSSNFASCYCEVSTSTYNPFVSINNSASRAINCQEKCSDLISSTSPSAASASPSGASASPSGASASPSGASASPSTASASPSTASASPSTASASPSTASASPSTDSASPSTASASPSTASASPSTDSASPSTASASLSTASASLSTASASLSTASASPSTASASPSTASASPSTASASPPATSASTSATSASPSATSSSASEASSPSSIRISDTADPAYSLATSMYAITDVKTSPVKDDDDQTTYSTGSSSAITTKTTDSSTSQAPTVGKTDSISTMTTQRPVLPLYINEIKVGLQSSSDHWIELKGKEPLETVSSYVLYHNGQTRNTSFSLENLKTTDKDGLLYINSKTSGARRLLQALNSSAGLLRLVNSKALANKDDKNVGLSDCIAYQIEETVLDPKLVELCPSHKVKQITLRELHQNWTIGRCKGKFEVLEPSANKDNRCPSLNFNKPIYMKILKTPKSTNFETDFLGSLVHKLSGRMGCMLSTAFFLDFSANSSMADIRIYAYLSAPNQKKLDALYMCYKTLFHKKPVELQIGFDTVSVYRCYNSSYIIPMPNKDKVSEGVSGINKTLAFAIPLVVFFLCLIGGTIIYMRYKRKTVLGVLGMARYDADQDDLLVNMEDARQLDTNFQNPTYSQLAVY